MLPSFYFLLLYYIKLFFSASRIQSCAIMPAALQIAAGFGDNCCLKTCGTSYAVL
jgi:hypothetical protein